MTTSDKDLWTYRTFGGAEASLLSYAVHEGCRRMGTVDPRGTSVGRPQPPALPVPVGHLSRGKIIALLASRRSAFGAPRPDGADVKRLDGIIDSPAFRVACAGYVELANDMNTEWAYAATEWGLNAALLDLVQPDLTSQVTAVEHDALIDAAAARWDDGSGVPSASTLAAETGLATGAVQAWLDGGMQWPVRPRLRGVR